MSQKVAQIQLDFRPERSVCGAANEAHHRLLMKEWLRGPLAVLPDDSIVPASAFGLRGVAVVAALMPSSTMEQTMKLTDAQLILLSRASQRPDRCAEISANLKGGAVQKFVAKLLAGGLVEEVRAERHAGLAQRRGRRICVAPH
jgi:hypothetical protein